MPSPSHSSETGVPVETGTDPSPPARSQGQWTNRLFESFKKSDPVFCGSKRLSRRLEMKRSQRKSQVSD